MCVMRSCASIRIELATLKALVTAVYVGGGMSAWQMCKPSQTLLHILLMLWPVLLRKAVHTCT